VQDNQANKRNAEQKVKKDADGEETSSPRVVVRREMAGNQEDKPYRNRDNEPRTFGAMQKEYKPDRDQEHGQQQPAQAELEERPFLLVVQITPAAVR
jgi:hypothetical protein